jgi:mRNA interferase MazF
MADVGRGEIWMFAFPKPDKRRPVLVLTRGDMIRRLTTVTVAPLTSIIRDTPSEVVLGPDVGLKRPSAVNLHHLATVPREGLRSFVGSLAPEQMRQVREALLFALGF